MLLHKKWSVDTRWIKFSHCLEIENGRCYNEEKKTRLSKS